MHRGCLCIIFVLFLGFMLGESRYYASLPDELEDLREDMEDVDEQMSELEAARQELEASLGDLDSQLYNTSVSIGELQNEISRLETEIAATEAYLDKAIELQQEQYNMMKLRIQYLYENEAQIGWFSVLEYDSFADFINKASYVSSMQQYDRKMLDEYINTCSSIAEYKQSLEQQRVDLASAMEELQVQEQSLLASIAQKSSEYNDVQNMTDELAEQLAAMEEYEAQLEDEYEDDVTDPNEPLDPGVIQPVNGEEELLAAIIYCESGGESYQGQLAVGTVVLNRVASSRFPNTITGVIYQSGQFSPVASGRLAIVIENNLTSQSCRKAARQVLEGHRSGNWLFFRRNDGKTPGTVIGNHVFY